MNESISRFARTGEFLTTYGRQTIEALGVLVLGLILANWARKVLKRLLEKTALSPSLVATVGQVVYLLLILLTVVTTAFLAGVDSRNLARAMVLVGLGLIAVVVLIRPYLPSLPFKKGNTIKIGDLFGKVTEISVTHTHIKTFDGKMIFVPNTTVLKENVINYHFTPERRVKIDLGIGYDQDLLRAKQVIEEIMISDARTNRTPRPTTFVKDLSDSHVVVSGRCWVKNKKYWGTRCDLLEKVKLRFDQEGIQFAYPQLDVHLDASSDDLALAKNPELEGGDLA